MQILSMARGTTMRRMAIAGILLAMALSTNCAAQTRIRLATLVPSGTSYHHSLQAMGEKWKKDSNGAIALTIYADGTMGSEDEIVRRMRVGQLQAAVLTVAGLSEIDPSVSALQKMPLVYRSLDEAAYVRAKLAGELDRRLADKGFVVLFWADAGWVRFFSKEPGILPQDFKKMKIFVTAGDDTQADLLKNSGFHPVLLEVMDLLTALQTGMVDSVPTIPLHALSGQLYLSTHHMLEVNWLPLVGALILTRRTWDALTPAQRDDMLKSAADCGQEFQTLGRQENQKAVEAMKRRGLQVHPVSEEAENEWRRFSEGFYPQIRGTIVPADMFDQVMQVLRDYRATQGSTGK
jgi:TRAP-type C4-dicarboxylate transport system substrate-binding protein